MVWYNKTIETSRPNSKGEQNKSEAITHKTLEREQHENENENEIFFIRNIHYNITNNRECFMWSGI